MKITVTLKRPDALDDAIDDAFGDFMEKHADDENAVDLMEDERAAARKICERWIKHGEYATLVIDTDAKTCTVQG